MPKSLHAILRPNLRFGQQQRHRPVAQSNRAVTISPDDFQFKLAFVEFASFVRSRNPHSQQAQAWKFFFFSAEKSPRRNVHIISPRIEKSDLGEANSDSLDGFSGDSAVAVAWMK
jgi:hypothetical protein